MSATPERRAFLRLRALRPEAFWQRVENTAGTGTPDTYVVYRGMAGWIELKVGVLAPAKGTVRVPRGKLRPEQGAWLEGHARAGGRGGVAVAVPRGPLWLLPYSADLWRALGDGVFTEHLDSRNVSVFEFLGLWKK